MLSLIAHTILLVTASTNLLTWLSYQCARASSAAVLSHFCWLPGCSVSSCKLSFHFGCDQKAHCTRINQDLTVYCEKHASQAAKHKVARQLRVTKATAAQFLVVDGIPEPDAKEGLPIGRLGSFRGLQGHIRVGSVTVHALGEIYHSSPGYHNVTDLFPIGFASKRISWSVVTPNKRCVYNCRITDGGSEPLFVIDAEELSKPIISADSDTAVMELTSRQASVQPAVEQSKQKPGGVSTSTSQHLCS